MTTCLIGSREAGAAAGATASVSEIPGGSRVIDQDVSDHPAGRSAWPLLRRRRSVVPRRLVATGSGLLAQRCLVGIEPPLDLAPFGLRNDLDE